MLAGIEWYFAHSPWLGNLRLCLASPFADVVLVGAAILCGTIIGRERAARHKPAGMRTLTLICLGSTIFTMCSLLMVSEPNDRSRLAAGIVTGIGFLGAGTIIRQRGTVIGLTTAATIWVVAAIGIMVGIGYAAGGIALSIVVLCTLRLHARAERRARDVEAQQHVP